MEAIKKVMDMETQGAIEDGMEQTSTEEKEKIDEDEEAAKEAAKDLGIFEDDDTKKK